MKNGDALFFLPGMLALGVAAAALLSFALSLLLLRRYRHAVQTLMARPGASSAALEAHAARAPEAAQPTARSWSLNGAALTPEGLRARRRRVLARSLGVYALAALPSAAVLGAGTLADLEGPLSPWRAVLVVLLHLGPAALILPLVAGASPRRAWLPLAIYVGMIVAYFLWRGTGGAAHRAGEGLLLVAVTYGPPVLVLALFFGRRVRAVGPFVMLMLTPAAIGAQSLNQFLLTHPAFLKPIADVAFALGAGPLAVMAFLLVAGFVAGGALCWLIVPRLARRDPGGALSDQHLQVIVVWSLFSLLGGLDLAFVSARAMWLGPLAAAVFVVVSLMSFRLMPAHGWGSTPPPRLLFLRVFKGGGASDRLFRFVDVRWRTVGELCLIAGPDLATRTVEPSYVLDFIAGRLGRIFMATQAQWRQRVSRLGAPPDRTGLGRRQEFYCHNDVWQTAVRETLSRADLVLMDLRGFSASRQGARWEVELLAEDFPLDRVFFVVASHEERQLLETCLPAGRDLRPRVIDFGLRQDFESLWRGLLSVAGTGADPSLPPPAGPWGAQARDPVLNQVST